MGGRLLAAVSGSAKPSRKFEPHQLPLLVQHRKRLVLWEDPKFQFHRLQSRKTMTSHWRCSSRKKKTTETVAQQPIAGGEKTSFHSNSSNARPQTRSPPAPQTPTTTPGTTLSPSPTIAQPPLPPCHPGAATCPYTETRTAKVANLHHRHTRKLLDAQLIFHPKATLLVRARPLGHRDIKGRRRHTAPMRQGRQELRTQRRGHGGARGLELRGRSH